MHATDATNASRTLLFNIRDGRWDDTLLSLFNIPPSLLPEVRDCAADYGVADAKILGAAIPILGVAGDQQAAAVGQACFKPGMMKATYGTGCFALLNIGAKPAISKRRLLTTIAYQLNGRRTYALEGSIFVAGAAVQWLRDGLKLVKRAADTGDLARRADPQQNVYFVPALVGLGAPHWDANARGAIFGITRGTTAAELARAALESVCYQTKDLIDAMHADHDGGGAQTVLRVDGGMVASDWTMQFLADTLNAPVDRPRNLETTAAGAAYLAGLQAGIYPPPEEVAALWKRERRFTPRMKSEVREAKLAGWHDAVRRTLTAVRKSRANCRAANAWEFSLTVSRSLARAGSRARGPQMGERSKRRRLGKLRHSSQLPDLPAMPFLSKTHHPCRRARIAVRWSHSTGSKR